MSGFECVFLLLLLTVNLCIASLVFFILLLFPAEAAHSRSTMSDNSSDGNDITDDGAEFEPMPSILVNGVRVVFLRVASWY